jgi:hypothetical protein
MIAINIFSQAVRAVGLQSKEFLNKILYLFTGPMKMGKSISDLP